MQFSAKIITAVAGLVLTLAPVSRALPSFGSSMGKVLQSRENEAVVTAGANMAEQADGSSSIFPPGICRRVTVSANNGVGILRTRMIQMGAGPRFPIIQSGETGFIEPYTWIASGFNAVQTWQPQEDITCQPSECLVLKVVHVQYAIKNKYYDCVGRSESLPFYLQSISENNQNGGFRCLPQNECRQPGDDWWTDETGVIAAVA